jgi:hypothetical protein
MPLRVAETNVKEDVSRTAWKHRKSMGQDDFISPREVVPGLVELEVAVPT